MPLGTLPQPTTGYVLVDSDAPYFVTVRVDGRTEATLQAYAERKVELSVGWHEVAFVDPHGRVRDTDWVHVQAFDLARADVDVTGGTRTAAVARPAHR